MIVGKELKSCISLKSPKIVSLSLLLAIGLFLSDIPLLALKKWWFTG